MKKIKKWYAELSTLDRVLFFCACVGVVFTIVCLVYFALWREEPDTLIISVFAALFGECGCCSFIWKKKYDSRNGGNDELD